VLHIAELLNVVECVPIGRAARVEDLQDQVDINPERFVVSHSPTLTVDVVHLIGEAEEMRTGGDGTGEGVLRECELCLEVVPLAAELLVPIFQDVPLI
jgi:hypothetical protein